MGVVYTAHDLRLKRQVAIKLLTADLTRDETAKQRFLQEAQAASALDHPNICNIHEINETDDGQLYLVMAYYAGETLKQRIERGALAQDDAVDIATQVGQVRYTPPYASARMPSSSIWPRMAPTSTPGATRGAPRSKKRSSKHRRTAIELMRRLAAERRPDGTR